jgi:hypothetical protein
MRPQPSEERNNYWLSHCGWCDCELDDEGPRMAAHGKFRNLKDYRKNEGLVVQFYLANGRPVLAYVVTRNSPAKKEGKEVVFQVCSERCREELCAAMKSELELFG